MADLIPAERIENKIYLIRGKKVMLNSDLADLYGVPTKRLNEQVKRNMRRFPDDFMFVLNKKETKKLQLQFAIENSRSQIATLKRGYNIKYLPYVFTEQGVAMLSSVLNSERAIEVNILIMRTFTKLRQILSSRKDILKKIETMESKYDQQFKIVFDAIKALIEPPLKPKPRIGFRVGE